jgi:Domain of unknown function (DUF4326)
MHLPKGGRPTSKKVFPKSSQTVPHRVQLSRARDARLPPNTLRVDRATKWGNPFRVGVHGDRAECVAMFEGLMAGRIYVSHGPDPKIQQAYYEMVKRDRRELRGLNLACWCTLDGPCHADVLLKIKQLPWD